MNLTKFFILSIVAGLVFQAQVNHAMAQELVADKPQISKIEAKVEKAGEGLNIRIDWRMDKAGIYSYLFSKGQSGQEILARYQPPTTGSSSGGFYIDPDVREGETYTYSVIASDEAGDVSDQSSITVLAKLPDCKVDETKINTGLPEGTSSLKFTPSRYTLNGGDKNNLIPVGSVQFSLYVAPKINQQKSDKANLEFSDISTKTTLDGIGTSLREILCKMIAKISPNKLTKIDGAVVDNGTLSGIIFTKLPSGDYLLFMNKNGFKGILVEFSLEEGQEVKLPLAATALQPEVGAEPLAFAGATFERVVKFKDQIIRSIDASGTSYLYDDNFPWWGWQKESEKLRTTKPQYKNDQPGVVAQ